MNNSFLTKLAQADTKLVTKGGAGSRKSIHSGDAYINKQGRMFGISSEHSKYFDIENGEIDGTVFIKVRESQPTGTDKQTKKPTFAKTAFSTSAESTGTAFITVTKLCRELFGDNKDEWEREFEKQGEQDGYTFYTLVDKVAEPKADDKSDKKGDAKADKKADAKQSK